MDQDGGESISQPVDSHLRDNGPESFLVEDTAGHSGRATARRRRALGDVFAPFQAPQRDIYVVLLVEVFGAAEDRYESFLTFDDIKQRLAEAEPSPIDDEELVRRLDMLAGEWGLLDASQNPTVEFATAEEYERKSLQYMLSERGRAAIAGFLAAVESLEATGSLQVALLDAIVDRLRELARIVGDRSTNDRNVYTTFEELRQHLRSLQENTRTFWSSFQRVINDDITESSVFADLKQRTLEYIERFVANLDTCRTDAATYLAAIERVGGSTLIARVVDGADLHQLPGAADPTIRLRDQTADAYQGVVEWFTSTATGPPRIDDLDAIARQAVGSLLDVLGRLRDARRRHGNVSADLLTLAGWFTSCSSEQEAHQLFNAAFGLWPSRHAHLDFDNPAVHDAGTPWPDVPPVPVSPLLRTHGVTVKRARTAKVTDPAAARRRNASAAIEQRQAVERAWAELATDGRAQLSDLEQLEDHETLTHLLALIHAALSTRPTGKGRAAHPDDPHRWRSRSRDGRLEITLVEPAQSDAIARLETPEGVLTAPDFELEVVDLRTSARARRVTSDA